MKRVLTALAVASMAIFVVAGCNDYGNTFQANTGAQITTLSPSNIVAGSPSFTLTVTGNGFVTQTYISWNGLRLATLDVTDSSGNVLAVTAVISAALVAKPGQGLVQTHNPFSGAGMNGLSNPLNFIINPAIPPNPVPLLFSINPTSVTAGTVGAAGLPVVLTGSNFVINSDSAQAATVFWNTTSTSKATQLPIASGTVSSTSQITVTVPASLLAAAGTGNIFVVNPPNNAGTPPAGGGGMSAPLAFTINAAPQAATAMTKAQAATEETPALSADGRYVTYTGMQGQNTAVFLRDTCEGAATSCQPQTSMISVGNDGNPANDDSHTPSMSADARYVAFTSAATNLLSSTATLTSGRQIYLRDACTGAPSGCVPSTQLISTDASGQLVGTESILPSVSASGRFVAFVAVTRSKSPSAGATQNNASPDNVSNSGFRQVFVRDTCLGASSCTAKTTRISLQPGDGTESAPAAASPAAPALSGDAKKVALTGSGTAVLFMRSVAVDDRVFVAALGQSR